MARNTKDDPRLIQLCTECTKASCNGSKCIEYRKMESSIAGKPSMELIPLEAPRRSSGENGLRLHNLIIDMLEDLYDQSDARKQIDIRKMIDMLSGWRIELFKDRINWYSME